MKKLFCYTFVTLTFLFLSCNKDELPVLTTAKTTTPIEIINAFNSNYEQLPEKRIAVSLDSSVYAQYITPTTKYTHGILGDQIEAEGLVVYNNNDFITLKLADNYVFEDIVPRLVDVNKDNKPEVVCIRTERNKGAGIAIYEIEQDTLVEYAFINEIGTPNRWLNLVGIFDLDKDNNLEIAWIETPHIGGILKVGVITSGEIISLDEYSTVSNHTIGETNLCLSALIEENDSVKLLVPNQDRNKVLTFNFSNERLSLLRDTSIAIDFSKPIYTQLDRLPFLNENNCKF